MMMGRKSYPKMALNMWYAKKEEKICPYYVLKHNSNY